MTDGLTVAAKRWLRWPMVHLAHARPDGLMVDSVGDLRIGFLADDPKDFEVFVFWLYEEWSRPRGESLQTRRQSLGKQRNVDHLPIALTAYWQDKPAGIVSLRPTDLRTRPGVYPWLSALYVDAGFRGQGIGRALVHAVEELARWLGYDQLYLFTPDRQSFYLDLGWELLSRLPEEDRADPPNDVFRKYLA